MTDTTEPTPVPSPPPACPVLRCPWQPSEDDELEGHLYDAHSARQLAAALLGAVASFEAQAAMVSGLLKELDAYRDQATAEPLRVRLWLIEQALQPITVAQDPAGIGGNIGPYLDGPIHPDWTAAYRNAHTTTPQES